jgi:uncharacterized membrane protein YGL010W
MENVGLFVTLFIIGFMMSIVGVYLKGYFDGRKKMLGDLLDKKIISPDIYVQFLKSLES